MTSFISVTFRPLPNRGLIDRGFRVAGLGGDNCGGYNHSDESKGNQNIMHWVVSSVGSSELVHTLMIVSIVKFLNPTKTAPVIKSVLPACPP
jgi:hypothetical protein